MSLRMISRQYENALRMFTEELADQILKFMLKDAFTLQTLLLIGALAQIALFALLPYPLATIPAVILILKAAITTAFQTAQGPSNPYMAEVLPGRTSAQLPSSDDGSFGSQPAARPVVVFHFGIRFNHPLGVLAPGAKQARDHFRACNDLVMERAQEYGLLGMTPWRAGERASRNTLMMVYYFRDVEGLNKFAHDDIHRKAWDWIVKAGHKHIGFFHEAFCVPPKAYESIYVNLPPLLMGATNVKHQNEVGEEVYTRPLVSADVGPLRSQFGRMGKAFNENIKEGA